MEVQTTEVEYCKLKVSYTGDFATIETKRKKVMDDFRKLPMPGFRAGKATDQAIIVNFKEKVEEAVKQEMLNHAFDDILFETKVKPLGQPQVLDAKLSSFGFSCEMMLLKKPDFELKTYKEFELPKPHHDTDENTAAEEILQELRVRGGDVVPYSENDFVQLGDKVTMDVEITEPEKEPTVEEGMLYEVGSNLLPEFDTNILGMSPDEERDFDVKVGEKTAKVKVKLHMGMRTTPAEANDEFAVRFGFKDMAEMMTQLISTASQKITMGDQLLLQDQVNKRLVAEHDFEIPEWLLNMESQLMAAQENLDWSQLNDEVKELIRNKAKDQIKLSLILDSIREAEPTSVMNDNEVLNYLVRILEMQGQDPAAAIKELDSSGRLMGVVASLKNEFTTQWIIDSCKLVE